MKTRFRFAAVLLFALAGSLAHQAAHAYALFFQTSANPVNVGDTFTVNVMLDDPASLASADFVLGFEKALVSLTGASSSSFGAGLTSLVDDANGRAAFSLVDGGVGFAANATGPISLVEVSFKALAEGSATIEVLTAPHTLSLGLNLQAPRDTVTPDVSDARVDVRIRNRTVQIPEPESLALLGIAIAAAGVGAVRRRSAA